MFGEISGVLSKFHVKNSKWKIELPETNGTSNRTTERMWGKKSEKNVEYKIYTHSTHSHDIYTKLSERMHKTRNKYLFYSVVFKLEREWSISKTKQKEKSAAHQMMFCRKLWIVQQTDRETECRREWARVKSEWKNSQREEVQFYFGSFTHILDLEKHCMWIAEVSKFSLLVFGLKLFSFKWFRGNDRKNICFAKVQKSTEKETRINIRNNPQNEQKTRRKKKWPKKVTTRSVIPKSPKFGRVFSQKTWKQIYECDSIENLWFLIFRVKNTEFQGKLTPSIIGFVLHDNHTATKINLPSQN